MRGLTVSAVNAVGVRHGIRVGAALADVRAAIPTVISRTAEPDRDRIALLRLARWAGRFGPNRHIDRHPGCGNGMLDGLWIDITGVAHLYGGEEALLDDLIRRLASFGVTAKAGLADTLGAANALARFGCDGDAAWVLAPQGLTKEALSDIPVEGLRLDSARVLLLKRLGLRRIGQLTAIPRANLERRFRAQHAAGDVLTRLDQALGTSAEPRRPMATPPVLSAMRQFAEPLMSSQAIAAVTADLTTELCTELSAKQMAAKAIRLSLYRSDGTCAAVAAAMSSPCRDGAHLASLITPKLETIDAGFGIDMMRLDAVRVLRHHGEQTQLTNAGEVGARVRRADPALLIDRLTNRFGASAVTVLEPRASHIPERSEVRRPAIAANSSGAASYVPPWPYAKPQRRPPFMLARPELIDVMAEVPDGPPVRFVWRRVERRVARAEGPERLEPEWWRTLHLVAADPSLAKHPRPRDYYTIEDQHGASYWVFRHGLYGAEDCDEPPQWFLHGLYA